MSDVLEHKFVAILISQEAVAPNVQNVLWPNTLFADPLAQAAQQLGLMVICSPNSTNKQR